MVYKNYIAQVSYDEKAEVFFGRVINTKDIITFQGTSVNELKKALHDSVEDYLEWCKEDGIEPEKPFSGKFNIRITPELHKEAALIAKKYNFSLNKFVTKAIKDEIESLKMDVL